MLNAAVQEFNLDITYLKGADYCCYPYLNRDCSDAKIIHAWGLNKFWNDYYTYLRFPAWKLAYNQWVEIGGEKINATFKPEVSVLIPCYNPDLSLLKECLNSVLDQNRANWERYSNYEVIIVAEPSENNESLSRLVSTYKDPRLRLVINPERCGIAKSLNIGIRLSLAPYIARVDADDICSNDRLYKQLCYLENNPDKHICTSDFRYFGDINEYRCSFGSELSKAWSLLTCPFDHPTIMMRKSFFVDNSLNYDESRGFVEDWELWVRAFEKGMKVGVIHECLYYHRWITNGSAGQNSKSLALMKQQLYKNFKKLDVEILQKDLEIIGPFSGKVKGAQNFETIKGYFKKALDRNLVLKIYDQTALEEVFRIRLNEATNGDIPEIIRKTEEIPQANKPPKKASIKSRLRRKVNCVLWFLFKPAIKPFKKYMDKINNIQDRVWAIEGHVIRMNERLCRMDKKIDNVCDRLDSDID